jgi:hypothetical protein
MILDLHRQMLFALHGGKTFRQSPGFQDAAKFQPEIIMQTSRGMFLNDESRRALAA